MDSSIFITKIDLGCRLSGHVMPSTCSTSEARLVGLHASPNLPDRFCATGYNPEPELSKHPRVNLGSFGAVENP